jgi:L-fucose mutarotase
MLKGISPVISPDLLKTLAEMGHGDEIVLADAHFPGHSLGPSGSPRVHRADGVTVYRLLQGIMPLFELDAYESPLLMMQAVPGDLLDPEVQEDYMGVVRQHAPLASAPLRLEREAFYERARRAFAVVMTGETRKYGNLILKKGVTS